MPARPVIDDALGDGDALLARNGRQEPVHFAVELERLDDLGSKRFERASVVVQVYAGRAEISQFAIIDGRRREKKASFRFFRQPQTMSCATFERFDEARNIAWIVLQIAIGRDDRPARVRSRSPPRRPPSGRNCGGTE